MIIIVRSQRNKGIVKALTSPDLSKDEFGGKLKKNESVTVYTGRKMSGRAINRVLLSKGWKIASVERHPLFNSETEHHWQVIKTKDTKSNHVAIRWKIATDDEMKKTAGMPKCSFTDSFRVGFEDEFEEHLEVHNDSPGEMEKAFQSLFETPVENTQE